MWNKILLFWVKLFMISHNSVYWKNNRPKRIGNSSVNKEKFDKLIGILKRAKKTIPFKTLKIKYLRIVDNELKRDYLNYTSGNLNNLAIDDHLEYVKYLYDQEKKRQENIDNKAKHNFTIISLIISTLAVGIPLLLFNSEIKVDLNLFSKIAIVVIGIILFLVLFISTYILNTKRYNRPQQEIVLQPTYFVKDKFKTETVLTYIACLYYNMKTNNRKSLLLSWNYRLISISIVLLLTFFSITFSGIEDKEDKEIKVKISNQLELEEIDKNIEIIQNKFDTISQSLFEIKQKLPTTHK